MLQNTLNIFLDIYYICVFENKTKKIVSWMCRNLKDIFHYSPHNLPEVHDPILFWKTLFYEKIHFKALFN